MIEPKQIAKDLGLSLDNLRRAALSEGDFSNILRVRGALDEGAFGALRSWARSTPVASGARHAIHNRDIPTMLATRLAERAGLTLERIREVLAGKGSTSDAGAVQAALRAAGWAGRAQESAIRTWAVSPMLGGA